MKVIFSRFFPCMWVFVALFLLFPQKVSANALPYSWEGGGGGELLAGEDCPIEVRGEKLSFALDSRKSGYTLQAEVTAAYRLANPLDRPCAFSAVFPMVPADGLNPWDSEVLWNGEPVPFRQSYRRDLPEALAALGREQLLLLDFSLDLGPGEEGELVVRSRTQEAMERDTVFHYLTTETRYTFLYFLSPAGYWGDFRDLEVQLRLSGAAPLLTESSLDFRRALGWRRYVARSSTLPEGELSFTVVRAWWMPLVYAALLIGLAVGLAVFLRKWRRKKK